MNPSHFPQVTRPRSRSPSPNIFIDRERDSDDEDHEISRYHDESRRHHRYRSRSFRVIPTTNYNGINNLPVPCDESTTVHDSERRLHRLIPRIRRHSDGEMNNLTTNGPTTSYGSVSINHGSPQFTQTPSPSEDGTTISNITSDTGCAGRPRSPRLKRQKSYYTPSMVDELRKRNRLYFMDPITKLRYFHGFPWKLTLQIFKIVLITGQIIIFGSQRENIVNYFASTHTTLEHLLLKNWDASYETMPYPPATGTYALYTKAALFAHMNNVLDQYYNLPENSLAVINLFNDPVTDQIRPVELCFTANWHKASFNNSEAVSGKLLKNCTYVYPSGKPHNQSFDVAKYLNSTGFYLPFNRTLNLHLEFEVNTLHMNLLQKEYGPSCYNMTVRIKYTNHERSGQMLIGLTSKPSEVDCGEWIMSEAARKELASQRTKFITYDSFVMGICALSTILCSRSLHRSNMLRDTTAAYFKLHRNKPFTLGNHMEFINVWYILIICNDILTVMGSAFKIQLETRNFTISSHNYEICSIFLGIGIFLTYVGILRYLGFFKSYNVLILTLKTSFPHVVRFLVCAICLYIGFLFCGWIVFSPYHIKFAKLSTASECLFSLVNGDDMFVTFSALTVDNDAIWYFHRAYLYIFISLFIYVVLSVFIAVIMDNYENLKYCYEKGFPESEIQKFIKEDGGMSKDELFSHTRKEHTCSNWFFCLFPCLACCRSKRRDYQGIGGDRQNLFASI